METQDMDLQPEEREALEETISEWLDGAPDTEKAMWEDVSVDDPAETLTAVTTHAHRTNILQRLREKLRNAA